MATTKKRINITIDQDVYNRVRGSIKNISAFVDRCLLNYLENGNYKYKPGVKTRLTDKDIKKYMEESNKRLMAEAKQKGIPFNDYVKQVCEIANYKWTRD